MWFPSQPSPPHPQPQLSALTQPSPSPAFHPFPFLLSSSLTLLFFYREHLAILFFSLSFFFSLSLSLSLSLCLLFSVISHPCPSLLFSLSISPFSSPSLSFLVSMIIFPSYVPSLFLSFSFSGSCCSLQCPTAKLQGFGFRDFSLVLPCCLPFVNHGRRGLGHRFACVLDRHCGIRLEAIRTVGNGSPFASILGLMREQTLSSTPLCPVIYRFPEQLCESWSGTPEGQGAEAFGCRWRCYGPRQDVATDASVETYLRNGLGRYDSSSEQAMAVIKSAMSYTQLCSQHILKFSWR